MRQLPEAAGLLQQGDYGQQTQAGCCGGTALIPLVLRSIFFALCFVHVQDRLPG